MKILAIGNSFSEDATAYLHDIAKLGGTETKTVNLCIGSCSLETHWKNVLADNADYDYQLNGNPETGKKVSLSQALTEEDWDIITLQQASRDSGVDTSYYPFIKSLSTYVKKCAPNAQQFMHQTWAYENGCTHEGFANYNNDQAEMHRAIVLAVLGAARNIKAKIIPCGEIFHLLRAKPAFDHASGGQSLCEPDGYHAHAVYGRYALAATWYEVLLGGNILANPFLPPDAGEPIKPELIQQIKEIVHTTITK